jgi:hypothetical protein
MGRHLKRIESEIEKTSRQTVDGFGVQFEAISPRRGLHGGIASYPQAVITPQLSNCDIYIGFMWTRVGTPTKKSTSGTVEEFEQFLKRWKKKTKRDRIDIRFYFLDKAARPSTLDSRQLKHLKEFQSVLAKAGVLYKEFTSVSEILDDMRDELHAMAKTRARSLRRKKYLTQRAAMRTSAAKMSSRVVKSLLHDS